MKWFKNKNSLLTDSYNNQFYTVNANDKYNGIVLEYNDIDITICENTHIDCKIGDKLISINNINVNHTNLEKILYRFKNKNKKLKFQCYL